MTTEFAVRKVEIFVSYSHSDVTIVRPIINLLRSAGPHAFRDEDDILPGKRWRAEIFAAIEECRLLWVFWCAHASGIKRGQTPYCDSQIGFFLLAGDSCLGRFTAGFCSKRFRKKCFQCRNGSFGLDVL